MPDKPHRWAAVSEYPLGTERVFVFDSRETAERMADANTRDGFYKVRVVRHDEPWDEDAGAR